MSALPFHNTRSETILHIISSIGHKHKVILDMMTAEQDAALRKEITGWALQMISVGKILDFRVRLVYAANNACFINYDIEFPDKPDYWYSSAVYLL